MASVATYLLVAVGIYWTAVFWRRWTIHTRTQQFVLEQRRKAGIPDSDKRPLAVASADAAQRRQRAFEEQLRQAEDVFGPAQPAPYVPPREKPAPRHIAKAEPFTKKRTAASYEPRKRERDDNDVGPTKRNRTIKAYPRAQPSRKRQADAVPEARSPKARRKGDDDVSFDFDEMADVSDSSQPEDESVEEVSMDEDDELVPGPEHSKKRSADTSDDHHPGDEWLDANGLRWKIGDDKIPRRLVTLVEMKPKYRMPRDATHADSKARVPTYTERFLSHDEYEEAKRKKQLSWQHELALSKNSAANSPTASDDNVEDSLASLVSRRSKAGLRRGGANELLYSDASRTPQQVVRSRASSVAGDDSFGASLSEKSDESRSFSSSISANVTDTGNLSTSRRLSLARSPAHAALRAPRYAHAHVASPSPLSPARGSLDPAAKRRREEQIMSQIRASRESDKDKKSGSAS